MMQLIYTLLLPALVAAVPYKEYILAPSSRDLLPVSVHQINGSVTNANAVLKASSDSAAVFHGVSSVAYDFGKNVQGLVSLDVQSSSSESAYSGVTFTESSQWISSEACDATANTGLDAPLWFLVGDTGGTITPEAKQARGGFRYLTIVSNTTATVNLKSINVKFTAAPTQQDLQAAYIGWFHSNDELLNRIWYAGAYTDQLCTVDPEYGYASSSAINNTILNTWWSNTTIANGTSTITDGAKRDRAVWPGDKSISLQSIAVSSGDLYSLQAGIEALFALQSSAGQLPWGGIPFNIYMSFTYHCHSLIAMSFLYGFSGDTVWLGSYWDQYVRGVEWVLESVDSTGLANVTDDLDWLRYGMGAHNIEANAILYYVLGQAQDLGEQLGEISNNAHWANIAAGIKSAANNLLWDRSAGLYMDNETTTLHPQDGNSWAVKSGLTNSSSQSQTISNALKARWGPYGAPAPEAGAMISPFVSGFELQAYFLANQLDYALDLMRLEWGYMLNDAKFTQSTFIEGNSTDGSIHYAAYDDDARISQAHGWSTGPTYALTAYAAGIQLTGSAGSTWTIAPLKEV